MRVQKYSLFASVIFTIIGLTGYLGFIFFIRYFGPCFDDVKSVCLSFFVTGFMTSIWQVIAYRNQRQNSLEAVLQSIFMISSALDKIEYVDDFSDFDDQERLVQSYLYLKQILHDARFGDVYGNLNFIIGNSKVRMNLIYCNFYKPCEKLSYMLLELNRVVNDFPAPAGVVQEKLKVLQDYLFTAEISWDSCHRIVRVFGTFNYNLLMVAWKVRRLCYGRAVMREIKEPRNKIRAYIEKEINRKEC